MDPDLIDDPDPGQSDCWTYVLLVQIHPAGEREGGKLIDITSHYSSPNVSSERLLNFLALNLDDFLRTFQSSPKFHQRFGDRPSASIVATTVYRGC